MEIWVISTVLLLWIKCYKHLCTSFCVHILCTSFGCFQFYWIGTAVSYSILYLTFGETLFYNNTFFHCGAPFYTFTKHFWSFQFPHILPKHFYYLSFKKKFFLKRAIPHPTPASLHCCVLAYSSGTSWASHCRGQALGVKASISCSMWAQELQLAGSRAWAQ